MTGSSFNATNGFSTWGWLCAPYIKSGGHLRKILLDPVKALSLSAAASTRAVNFQTFYSELRYERVTYLTDVTGSNPMVSAPVSATAPAAPAETILLGAKYARAENTSGSIWGTGFGPKGGLLSNVQIDPPDCRTCVPWCLDGWGTGGFHQTTLKLSEAAGGLTGGLSLRNAGNAVVAFMDGHSKSMKPGALAAGTNYSRTQDVGQLKITDITKYLWDTL